MVAHSKGFAYNGYQQTKDLTKPINILELKLYDFETISRFFN
jgi:hypothetical protein